MEMPILSSLHEVNKLKKNIERLKEQLKQLKELGHELIPDSMLSLREGELETEQNKLAELLKARKKVTAQRRRIQAQNRKRRDESGAGASRAGTIDVEMEEDDGETEEEEIDVVGAGSSAGASRAAVEREGDREGDEEDESAIIEAAGDEFRIIASGRDPKRPRTKFANIKLKL